jgi:hypothetical protein
VELKKQCSKCVDPCIHLSVVHVRDSDWDFCVIIGVVVIAANYVGRSLYVCFFCISVARLYDDTALIISSHVFRYWWIIIV